LEQRVLLGEADSIQGIADFIKANPNAPKEELERRFPIYKYAADCQERLKVNGDWVIFPRVIRAIADGRYARDEFGNINFDGKPLEV
jgi:hypothetical protein